ncbi:hypothetical protein tb265_43150 [Gemmatimonadetes bacterium T265]|nr:hypothetical protein tb265_43150 [Gemmatimonadetes bacterium T265]
MAEATAKQLALRAVQELPDEATVEDAPERVRRTLRARAGR